MRKIIEILPVGLWIADPKGYLLSINPMGLKIWGLPTAMDPTQYSMIGSTNYSVFKARRFPSGEEIAADDWALVHTLRDGVTVTDELLEIDAFDGQKRIIVNYTAPVIDPNGNLEAGIVVNHDITDRQRAETALQFTQTVVDQMSDAAYWALPNGRLVYANQAASRMLEYAPAELLALSTWELVPNYSEARWAEHWRQLQQAGSLHFESRHRTKRGELFPVEIRADYLQFQGREYACGLVRDITERKQLQEALREQAIRDALTGLFNRRYLDETLPRELSRCQRDGIPLTVAMLDLDHFKNFNDDYSHEAGDIVLRAVGDLLQCSLRSSDIACRYGGEELVLILPGAMPADALTRLEALRHSITHLRLHYRSIDLPTITVSIGLAVAPSDDLDAATLLSRADAALYRAKESGRNCVVIADVEMT